jgi:hypothetical protein
MRRTVLTGVLASALLVTAGGVASAVGRDREDRPTLRLRSQIEHANYVDNAPTGKSAGDVLVFTERLLDESGSQVGSDAATCTVLFDERSLCTGAYVLPRGQIMVQLVQPGPAGTYDQAITGGTGGYAGVTGTVTVEQGPGGDRFTFRTHLPRRR